jgi:hypothetical protein
VQHIGTQSASYLLRKVIIAVLLTSGVVVASIVVPNTSHAADNRNLTPLALTCSGAPGIAFSAPWSLRTITSSENARCNSRADRISVTADLLHYSGGVWRSIDEAGQSCPGCYNNSVSFQTGGIIYGDKYKVEGWFSAKSGNSSQGESGFTRCYYLKSDGPYLC